MKVVWSSGRTTVEIFVFEEGFLPSVALMMTGYSLSSPSPNAGCPADGEADVEASGMSVSASFVPVGVSS